MFGMRDMAALAVLVMAMASWISAATWIMRLADARGRAATAWGIPAGAVAIAGSCVGFFVYENFHRQCDIESVWLLDAIAVALVLVLPWLPVLLLALELRRLPSKLVPPIPVAIRVDAGKRD